MKARILILIKSRRHGMAYRRFPFLINASVTRGTPQERRSPEQGQQNHKGPPVAPVRVRHVRSIRESI